MESSPWAPTQVFPSCLMRTSFSVHFTGTTDESFLKFLKKRVDEGPERAQKPKAGEEGGETLSGSHGVDAALVGSQWLWCVHKTAQHWSCWLSTMHSVGVHGALPRYRELEAVGDKGVP